MEAACEPPGPRVGATSAHGLPCDSTCDAAATHPSGARGGRGATFRKGPPRLLMSHSPRPAVPRADDPSGGDDQGIGMRTEISQAEQYLTAQARKCDIDIAELKMGLGKLTEQSKADQAEASRRQDAALEQLTEQSKADQAEASRRQDAALEQLRDHVADIVKDKLVDVGQLKDDMADLKTLKAEVGGVRTRLDDMQNRMKAADDAQHQMTAEMSNMRKAADDAQHQMTAEMSNMRKATEDAQRQVQTQMSDVQKAVEDLHALILHLPKDGASGEATSRGTAKGHTKVDTSNANRVPAFFGPRTPFSAGAESSAHGYVVRDANHRRSGRGGPGRGGGRLTYTSARARYAIDTGAHDWYCLSIVTVVSVYANVVPVRTVLLGSPTLASWVLPRRSHDTYTAWDAFVTLPLVQVVQGDESSTEASTQAIGLVIDALAQRFESEHFQIVDSHPLSMFASPVSVGDGMYSYGILRLDVRVTEGADLEWFLDALDSYRAVPNVVINQPVDRFSELYTLARACTNAVVARPPPQGALADIVTNLMRVSLHQPSVPESGNAPASNQDGPERVVYGDGDSAKRVSWSKDPVTDISSLIPEYTGSLRRYHWGGLQALHSANRSRIPLLLKETKPYDTFMAALLSKHLAANPLVAAQMADQTIMESLANAHRLTLAEFGDAIEKARNDPSRENIDDFYDLIAMGALNVRAAANGTSAVGELQSDADVLIQFVTAAVIESHLEYGCQVNDAYTKVRQMLGEHTTYKMMAMGMVSQLLPVFVGRLSPYLRDRALEYWNSVAREFRYDGPLRDVLPTSLRDRLDSHLSLHREVNASAPAMMSLARVMRLDLTDMNHVTRVMQAESSGSTVRIIHVPADLYWIAPTGILLSHWHSFMRHLLGSHTKSVRPAHATIFEMSTAGDVDGSAYEFPDDGSDYDDDVAAVGMNAQTRTQDGRVASSRASAAASGSDGSLPADPTKRRAAPARVRFDPNALAKWEKRAGDTIDAIKGAHEKISAVHDSRVDKLADSLEKSMQSIRHAMDARDERMRDEGSFLRRTLEKVLQTIAGHTTDLKHAGVVTEAAAAVAARPSAVVASQVAQPSESSVLPLSSVEPESNGELERVMSALNAVLRDRRPLTRDAEGFTLAHLKRNSLLDMCPEMRQVYEARDNVTTQQGFEAIAERPCRNCPDDSPNMPHREGHCPFAWRAGDRGNDNLSAASRERGRQKVRDNASRLSKGLPAMLSVDVDLLQDMVGDDDVA